MSTTTRNAHGTARIGPVRSGQRTAADVLADTVSLVVLLALGGFALAVSLRHTMTFVREHGQTQGWVVVGTALTVVGLTVQAGLETYRDSRAGRGRGWPAVLLGVAVGAELYANASTASGGQVARLVAAWPVLVAAAALALWTRRLQHAAEAAESAGKVAAALLWNMPEEQREAAAAAVRDAELAAAAAEHDEDQDDEADPYADELAGLGTAKERLLYLLRVLDQPPGPTDLAARVGCTKQYAGQVLAEWRARPENAPGQLALAAAAA